MHIGRRNSTPDYFDWLAEFVDLYSDEHMMYSDVVKYLYTTQFYCTIDLDFNRCKDATSILYLKYLNEMHIDYDINTVYDRDCSVLEVLIALSFRCERDIMSEPGSYDDAKWFWIMLDNLGLLELSDDVFDEEDADYILETWLDRDFAYNGNGSIFPILSPKRDQRQIEIWDQMADYIDENYPI